MPNPLKQLAPRTILTGTALLFLGPFLLVILFPAQLDLIVEKNTYLVFHNIAEFFSIMVCLSVFSVGWFTYEQSQDRHALFLGTALLAVGLLDFMHTMSNAAMPAFLSANSTNKSTQFWIAARLFDASAFLASAYIYPASHRRWLTKKVLLVTVLAITGLVFTGVVYFPDYLPATAVPGLGLTPLKRYLEFLVILLLVAAAVAYWRRMQRTENRALLYFPAAFIICIFSEGAFASYTTGFDTYNVLGHLYKVVAFYLIYQGVFIAAVKAPYEKLANAERVRHLASFPQLNPRPVLEISSSGEVAFANPAAVSLQNDFGLSGSDFSVFLPGDFEAILQDLKAKKETALHREVTIGERVFREDIYLAPQFDTARIYAFEVTEHKRAEKALRDSEQRVRLKLESILSPEGDLGNLELADIIDAPSLQALMDDFYALTGIPLGVIDIHGKVLVGVGWQEVCTKFHRVHPEACRNCIASDVHLSAGVAQGEYKVYKCKNNLWDVATPIMVGDNHYGNLFMGQFFFADEPLDYELFRAQARQFCFDEKRYVAALEAVPRLSRETLHSSMAFFMKLAGILSKLSYSNIKLAHFLAERDSLMAAVRKNSARTNLLAESASELLASDSPQEVVEALCQKVMVFLDCHAFFNFLVDEASGRLRLNACVGIPEKEKEQIEWLDYGVAVCGCAARDGCRIVAHDIATTPDPRTELVKSYGIQAYACHPLTAQGRVLGTLSFGTRSRSRFSDDDLALMKAVADQVAIAMERKRNEEELRHSMEIAEMATEAKSQFLANMSHELRTPMTGVLGMLDLVLAGNLEEEQRGFIGTAQTSARSLVRILNDILDLTKIEMGKFAIEERPFPIRFCVENTYNILLPIAQSKGLDLDFIVADEVPVSLVGDQTRLNQVLTNLAGNAVKFTTRGQVKIRVDVGGAVAGGKREVTFTVTDSGIGIPVDKQDRLFRPFSQVDESHSRSYGGTGLGLAISKEIVERMGGRISFTSAEGKGSTFFFAVPLAEAVPMLQEAGAARGTETGSGLPGAVATCGPRLLVAEDDAAVRQVLGVLLTRSNYVIDFAECGEQAVKMWETGGYDLILMDVQMPQMNGFEATAAIRAKERTHGGRIPIIAMTAHALKEDEERCLVAGMDSYISKPIDFKKSLLVIEEMLLAKQA